MQIEVIDGLNTYGKIYKFHELRNMNVTAYEILLWSASIDLAERYQYYIDQPNISLLVNEIFFNCTKPWFGSRCQYSFGFNETISLSNRTKETIQNERNDISSLTATSFTCYKLLECNRGGAFICLDWREVCDGRVDCLNDGVDEAQCFDLEINECKDNEYRCYNGLCVVRDSSTDKFGAAKCLDQSDALKGPRCPDTYYKLDLFTCEEYSCPPGKNQFSCGDGQCVEDYGTCKNGRHVMLAKSLSIQGNLPHDCWIAMTCLTKIIVQVNGIVCEQFLQTVDVIIHLHKCESLIQFPTIPVLFGHVSFLYSPKVIFNVDIQLALTPDYICYDEQLCDYLVPTFRYEFYACQRADEMGLKSNVTYSTWKSIIDSLKVYFQGCITVSSNGNFSEYPSLYMCKNSSKYISNYRIMDGISDCYLNDDEDESKWNCSLNNPHHLKYSNWIHCRSSLVSSDISSTTIQNNTNLDQILFHQICDRTLDLSPELINGRNHTDETECEHWQCSNIYTRCDGVWQCPKGEDEVNCGQSSCFGPFFECISPYNNTLMCLPADQVGDGVINCIGASDEHQYCRTTDFNYGIFYRFRCLNGTTCLNVEHLCNSKSDCALNDDELLCKNRQGLCEKSTSYDRTEVDNVLCRIGKVNRVAFTLETIEVYPPHTNEMINNAVIGSVEQHEEVISMTSEVETFKFPSRCHRGISAYLLVGNEQYSSICFCPPYYYGNMCQYQNQRVSLILTLFTTNRLGIYSIIISLIEYTNDQQELISYDQFTYVPKTTCSYVFNKYLLYSIRPKNISKNYIVHVDAYDKTTLTYLASWQLNVSFLFMPVNRITASLTLPTYPVLRMIYCPHACQKGTCMKYVNQDKFFCKCNNGWSGVKCDTPISCNNCSSDSLCMGVIQNQSICVCPIGKFGSYCHLKHLCPVNYCKNNGRCVAINDRTIDNTYICLCSEQFDGLRCENHRSKLEISIVRMETPSHLVFYLYRVSYFTSPVIVDVLLKKLTLSQRSLTLYNEYPYQMVFIEIESCYYLVVLQNVPLSNVTTLLDPTRRCPPINELFNSKQFILPRIQRVKYYHLLCQKYLNLKCFFDESYMCLCTTEHHANCFLLSKQSNFTCQEDIHCLNGGQCLQDRLKCPSNMICICTDCFFGDRCQFYGKGIGLTLDDMLRNKIRPNITFLEQPQSVKVWAVLFMILFFVGIVNSVLCLLVFSHQDSRKVGIGLYLLASSITSAFIVTMLVTKFWLVIYSQINITIQRSIFHLECLFIELILKFFLYMNNWLNACVAIERAVCIFKGIYFSKSKSKCAAKWTIFILPFLIVTSNIHELFYRDLFYDPEEQRVWCVSLYSRWIHVYSTIILFVHFFAPFFANVFSALFIVITLARQHTKLRTQYNYRQHLQKQIREHKQLIISPLILVILSVPHLIISLFTGCVKATQNSWLYLAGYFISFIPSTTLFIAFVVPSKFYTKKFKEVIKKWRQRLSRT